MIAAGRPLHHAQPRKGTYWHEFLLSCSASEFAVLFPDAPEQRSASHEERLSGEQYSFGIDGSRRSDAQEQRTENVGEFHRHGVEAE